MQKSPKQDSRLRDLKLRILNLFLTSIFRFRAFLLDLLFPPNPLARELSLMDAGEFSEQAQRTEARVGRNVVSLFNYSDPLVRQAIWELKYRGNKRIAALLAATLYDELLGFLEEYAPLTNFIEPLLVPIPLSRQRARKRGFNQCELLCEELIRLDSVSVSSPLQRGGLPARRNFGAGGRWGVSEAKGLNFCYSPFALRKIKDTQSQTESKNREERIKNLAGCFAADPNVVKGRNIILIDDVATTGATLEEAKRTLRAAGARKVIAFTVAH